MEDHIVFDVEIQKTIEELPHGWDSTHLMGVACACVWEYRTQRLRLYGPDDVDALRSRLLKADRITSFNGWRFDVPVIWRIAKSQWKDNREAHVLAVSSSLRSKTDDILERIWIALGLDPDSFNKHTHLGWGLDVVARGTLGVGKIGYGGDAPKWYQEGQWARVANYCADDVCLTRDLSDFIDRFGYIINGNTNEKVML